VEDLFSTYILIKESRLNYHVVFDNEKYVFSTEENGKPFSSFSFKREHDRWIEQQPLPDEIKEQALDALESYLLKQL